MPTEILDLDDLFSSYSSELRCEPIIFRHLSPQEAQRTPAGVEESQHCDGGQTASAAIGVEVIAEEFEDLSTIVRNRATVTNPVAFAPRTDSEDRADHRLRHLDPESEHELEKDRHEAQVRARQEGWEAGLARGREESVEAIRGERERLAVHAESLLRAFDASRERYLDRLEQEAAKLALRCAARILRREVQLDPLALTGAVRAALGQLGSSTDVRLIVPPEDETLWRESMGLIPGLESCPRVVGDGSIMAGECRVESDLGSVDLSVEAQLAVLEETIFHGPGEFPDGEQGLPQAKGSWLQVSGGETQE